MSERTFFVISAHITKHVTNLVLNLQIMVFTACRFPFLDVINVYRQLAIGNLAQHCLLEKKKQKIKNKNKNKKNGIFYPKSFTKTHIYPIIQTFANYGGPWTYQLVHNVKKYTFVHLRSEKTQIRLRIREVWSVFVFSMKKVYTLGYQKCAQWRFWSDCANAQADLNLRLAHRSNGTLSDVVAQLTIYTALSVKIERKHNTSICNLLLLSRFLQRNSLMCTSNDDVGLRE